MHIIGADSRDVQALRYCYGQNQRMYEARIITAMAMTTPKKNLSNIIKHATYDRSPTILTSMSCDHIILYRTHSESTARIHWTYRPH